MPFTLSHPVIAIPFLKSKYKFSATALIIGSIVPDFEYIFQLQFVDNIGHHIAGVFLFDLPAGILLCYFFHYCIRNSFVFHAPNYLYKYLYRFTQFNWSEYVKNNKQIFIISLFIGIVSHLIWDSFTHYDGSIILMFDVLRENINLQFFTIPVYLLLQIISSLFGLLMIYKYLRVEMNKQSKKINANKIGTYWVVFTLLFAAILVCRMLVNNSNFNFWDIVLFVIGSITYALIINSIIFFKPQHVILE